MMDSKKKICTYCAKWEPKEVMTPMYEQGKEGWVRYYCPKCIDYIKRENDKLPYAYMFSFGKPGE